MHTDKSKALQLTRKAPLHPSFWQQSALQDLAFEPSVILQLSSIDSHSVAVAQVKITPLTSSILYNARRHLSRPEMTSIKANVKMSKMLNRPFKVLLLLLLLSFFNLNFSILFYFILFYIFIKSSKRISINNLPSLKVIRPKKAKILIQKVETFVWWGASSPPLPPPPHRTNVCKIPRIWRAPSSFVFH